MTERPGDEVKLADDDEYEVVPTGPIRKLEKRIDKIESQQDASRDEGLIRDILDIMKANQKLVNDVVESTSMLRNSVGELTQKMDGVVDNMNEFMDLLKEATETSLEEDVSQEIGSHVVQPIEKRLEDMSGGIKEMTENIKDTNSQMLKGMQQLDERLKRIYAAERKSDFFSQQQQGQQQSQQRRRKAQQQKRQQG